MESTKDNHLRGFELKSLITIQLLNHITHAPYSVHYHRILSGKARKRCSLATLTLHHQHHHIYTIALLKCCPTFSLVPIQPINNNSNDIVFYDDVIKHRVPL